MRTPGSQEFFVQSGKITHIESEDHAPQSSGVRQVVGVKYLDMIGLSGCQDINRA